MCLCCDQFCLPVDETLDQLSHSANEKPVVLWHWMIATLRNHIFHCVLQDRRSAKLVSMHNLCLVHSWSSNGNQKRTFTWDFPSATVRCLCSYNALYKDNSNPLRRNPCLTAMKTTADLGIPTPTLFLFLLCNGKISKLALISTDLTKPKTINRQNPNGNNPQTLYLSSP